MCLTKSRVFVFCMFYSIAFYIPNTRNTHGHHNGTADCRSHLVWRFRGIRRSGM
jgi:hypothetical protein